MGDFQQRPDEVSGSWQYMIVNRITRMNDAKMQRQRYEYYVAFKFVCQMLMSKMDIPDKKRLQTDFEEMAKIEQAIINDTQLNDASRAKQLDDVHYMFADNREYYIMKVIPKTGIIKDMEDGEIDFTKRDVELVKKIVLEHKGLIESAKGAAVGLPAQA